MDPAGNREIPIRRVRSLLAVINHQSFTLAAEALGLTQPAVTQHVQQLEAQLGATLIRRQGGTIELTPAGAALLPALRGLLDGHAALLDQLRSLGRGTAEILRVASPASFAALFLAPAFAALRPRFPAQVLDVREIDDAEAFERLRSGRVDLAVTGIWTPTRGLVFEPLCRDRACVVLPAGHPLAGHAEPSIDEVIAYPFVRSPIGTASDSLVATALGGRFAELQVTCEARQLVTALAMVAAGLGLTVLPELSVLACRMEGIVLRPLAGAGLSRVTGLVTTEDFRPSRFVAALLAALRAAAAASRWRYEA
ncbi:DNA-binding transcriptional regulator, LysR family [Tistlia consotensis]|uniref:DNA-binding transcriptional regulator, LysR family n=1 Tax=Tistlia consotensis USBA 355 TaxID=560819 RepID=A0A1Y6B3A9_9PROT|nr:LysR family transcriptional regulator [Tistlia consotensis]SME89229.1 DNA-binding transcriptional regulator, LysR family [Tistlia consotensis USBA 355]SNR25800.1 DNA-binding transcriptional regulator, LysR family [Tistlia consotensis]